MSEYTGDPGDTPPVDDPKAPDTEPAPDNSNVPDEPSEGG